ncbi:MAG: C40 family peptidase [Bacteroidetes bacterium]|nr:C40 family peptidase [Bacteroidota bacterium]
MLAHCIVAASPIRISPQHSAEMISQLLFGETCEILEKDSDFVKIKMNFDGVEGWVLDLHLEEISTVQTSYLVRTPWLHYSHFSGNYFLSLGAEVLENVTPEHDVTSKEKLQKLFVELLNVPFFSGGRTVMGFDADGFVQICFKTIGISLPRNVGQQSEKGLVLDFLWESDLGDLAFFEDESGVIVHVGIMLNNAQVIHCYDKVRIDDLDSMGIYNRDLKKHTHKLRFIKRIL